MLHSDDHLQDDATKCAERARLPLGRVSCDPRGTHRTFVECEENLVSLRFFLYINHICACKNTGCKQPTLFPITSEVLLYSYNKFTAQPLAWLSHLIIILLTFVRCSILVLVPISFIY
jgi:hypothetical protein